MSRIVTTLNRVFNAPLFGTKKRRPTPDRIADVIGKRKSRFVQRRAGVALRRRDLVEFAILFIWTVFIWFSASTATRLLMPDHPPTPGIPPAPPSRTATVIVIALWGMFAITQVGILINWCVSAVTQTAKSRRLKQRFKSGHCLHCGYDCSALTPGRSALIKCPECGLHTALPSPVRSESLASPDPGAHA